MDATVFVARKPLTVLGVQYRAGQRVDLDRLQPGLRRRLVEFKRVVPRALTGAAADPALVPETVGGTVVIPARGGQARCGDFGGRMKNGEPCGRITAGLCQHHKN